MATNILAGMQYVQQQGELGRKQGQQQSFNRLAGQAFTAPAAQQNALVGQAVGIDPAAGVALGNTLASRNQAQETDHLKKIGGAARYMAQALQSKNPAQVQGAWQAVRPYLAQLTGKEPPQQWDPSFEPGVYKAIAMTGGAPDVRGVVVAPGSVLANPSTGESMLRNPAALQYHDVPMGEGHAAGAFDPSNGTVRPAVGGAAPVTTDPMQSILEQANRAIQMGAPQDKVEAWIQQQAQSAGLNPQPAGQAAPVGVQSPGAQPAIPSVPAQFGIGTPRPTAAQETWSQPVDEAGPDGKPIRVQYSNRGARRVVEGAAPVTKAADAKRQAQARQAKVSLQGTVAQLDRLEQAAAQLKADPGLAGITGLRGHIPDIPGSDAARARAQLETLGSQAAFGVLQQMREMSKTGGALGQVSDRENEMLRNNLAALGTNQSAEDFQKALDQIIAYARDSKARMQGAFTDTYGDAVPVQEPAAQAAGGDVGSLLSKYGVQ